jgi:hypothetical protein
MSVSSWAIEENDYNFSLIANGVDFACVYFGEGSALSRDDALRIATDIAKTSRAHFRRNERPSLGS